MSLDNVKNCSDCNKIFIKKSSNLCADCLEKENKKFLDVKQYIGKSRNSNATLSEIADNTEVEESSIIKWVKTGRLIIRTMENFKYPCESCGNGISRDRMCNSCKTYLLGAFSSDSKKETNRSSAYANRSIGRIH